MCWLTLRFVFIYTSSEGSGESATTTSMCNIRCVVAMLQIMFSVHCNKILDRTMKKVRKRPGLINVVSEKAVISGADM